MSPGDSGRRREARKFQRLPVRYGAHEPVYSAIAMQISTRGLFIATNEAVFSNGSPIVVEVAVEDRAYRFKAIVRHAFKVHPMLARQTRPGMGVEFVDVPDAVRDYLASL